MIIPFVGPCYAGRSSYWDGQESINLMLEQDQGGGKAQLALVGTPGLLAFATLNASGGEVRGVCTGADGNLYAVCGNTAYKVTPAGAVTTLGTLDSTAGHVSMAQNGLQMIVADGTHGYLLTFSSGAWAKITSANFPGASVVGFLDGYLAVVKPDSEQWFLSGIYDAATWDGLTWATAQGKPDKLVSMAVCHREVWLFGEESTEVWYNAGAAAPEFPLDRISGAFLDIGCAARMSPATTDNTVFWLTDSRQVVRAAGYSPQIVSTRQMEYELARYARVDDAAGFSYTAAGHSFYVLTFPSSEVTWVYDAATDAWHKRKSFGLGRWRVNCYARFKGRHIVGDRYTGKLYEISDDAVTEDGAPIERVRQTAPIHSEGVRLFMASLQIEFDCGATLAQGDDPQAMLQWSDDGGRTWSSEQWRSIGRVGQFLARSRWLRLGSFRSRQFRLSVVAPSRVVILGATAEITKGTN